MQHASKLGRTVQSRIVEEKMKHAFTCLGALALGAFCQSASAQTIIDDWSSVKADAAPALKPAAIEPKTTALLVMDLLKQSCNESRPRCVASLPKVKALIAAAQAHGVSVIWTMFPGPKPEDFLADVAPPAGTSFVVAPADKFVRTDLEKMLRDKGVTTVVTVGTVAEGAVLYTASQAALRGFKVVAPIEGMSSGSLYGEQVAAWTLTHAPTIAQNVTLTKMDMITYQ
jgi:nicotinamidase-related amidase